MNVAMTLSRMSLALLAGLPACSWAATVRVEVPGLISGSVCVDRQASCAAPATILPGADGRAVVKGEAGWLADVTVGDVVGSRRLVLRAPAEAGGVISGITTELVALMEQSGLSYPEARRRLAARIGVAEADLLRPLAGMADSQTRERLANEHRLAANRIAAALADAEATRRPLHDVLNNHLSLDPIQTIVVLYGENRSFDNLYGAFPGADGVANPVAPFAEQRDRDGQPLAHLPPVWGGLTAAGQLPAITQQMTTDLPNAPFAIDDPKGFATGLGVITRDLVHRFYQNQMQINGGRNDRFVAWGNSGALVMGHYDGTRLPLWALAREFTLADHFFMGGFGGSFFNHMYLSCACAPYYSKADASPAKGSIAVVNEDGVSLKLAANSPRSALTGTPKFVNDGNLTPDFHAVNTLQPAFQPSGNAPAAGGDSRYADPANPTTLPPQTMASIGDRLNARGIDWAWYSGAWQRAVADREQVYKDPEPNFQAHHQPFNYYANLAPGKPERSRRLKDEADFMKAIDTGRLPAVSFYKPQGNLNEHAGYASVMEGDRHLADIVARLRKSPQWKSMVVVITYDENGGFWDHVAPPKGDRWGPGTRIPALVISPFSRKGVVDHTQYDTGSILRLITHRFSLEPLPGLVERDDALVRNGFARMGDLSGALQFAPGVAQMPKN